MYLYQIAAASSSLFTESGNIFYLKEAEKKLVALNKKTNYSQVGALRGLARNYISQHRFKESLELLKQAELIGEDLNSTQKMLFDVHLELGNVDEAQSYLIKIKDFSDFHYLLRVSKWHDYKGDLASAIKYMEKATDKAIESNNKQLKIWSFTNLADFYGHNGQIKEAYDLYLETLALDPANAYAKKQIAWIVYSHDKNPAEALRILEQLSTQHKSPDYELLKAEIAMFINNDSLKEKALKKYLSKVAAPAYGEMYNQHLAKLYLEEFNDSENSLKYINKELRNRPTPASYNLLSWYYYKNKEYKKALEIVTKHVLNKTFEPEAQYHMAEIFKANGLHKEANQLKKELLESSFELGPVMTSEILKI